VVLISFDNDVGEQRYHDSLEEIATSRSSGGGLYTLIMGLIQVLPVFEVWTPAYGEYEVVNRTQPSPTPNTFWCRLSHRHLQILAALLPARQLTSLLFTFHFSLLALLIILILILIHSSSSASSSCVSAASCLSVSFQSSFCTQYLLLLLQAIPNCHPIDSQE